MWHQGRRAGRRSLCLAADQVGQLRPGTLVGHMLDVHFSQQFQVLKRQVPGAAVARRSVINAARIGLAVVDQFLQVLDRHRRIDHENAGHLGQQRHGGEIAIGIERQLGEHEGVDRQRADVADDQRVAVRLRLGHRLHGDIAGAPGAVVDDDFLAQTLGHFAGEGARHDRRAAARRERHHQADRFAWILILGDRSIGQRQAGGSGQKIATFHVSLLILLEQTSSLQCCTLPDFRAAAGASRLRSRHAIT